MISWPSTPYTRPIALVCVCVGGRFVFYLSVIIGVCWPAQAETHAGFSVTKSKLIHIFRTRHGPWHKRRPAVTSVPPPAGHHSALSGEELLPSVATWPHESDHDSTLGRGVGLAAPLAGQRSERPQKNKAHGGPVAPAQFSTEMALNDLESIGESIVMLENGFVR